MIITSNLVEHNYTIPFVRIVGDVDGFENVAEKVTIYINSSTSFDHTYETTIFDMENAGGIATTVTETKVVEDFAQVNVDLNTTGISTSSFTAWDNLEEDQVVQWCLDSDTERLANLEDAQEAKGLEKKDKILNPKKYYRDTPVTPWQIKKDSETTEN
mgnify:CR=1 FL=1